MCKFIRKHNHWIRLDNLTLVFNHLCCHDNDPNLTFSLINVISYKHILSVRKLRFIPVPIFKNNIQKFQRSSLFAKNRKVKNLPQPGRRPDGNYAKWAYSKRLYEKTKLIYSSSLKEWLHNFQSFLQAIFYLDVGFLFCSYTRAKKVIFRALMTPWILPYFRRL